MKNGRHFIAYLLLTVSLMMLMIPVVPHHHHYDDTPICLKADSPADCGCHSGHCKGNHTECNEACITHLQALTPSHTQLSDEVAYYPLTLFLPYLASELCRLLFRMEERQHAVYIEPLHGTRFARAFSLRGPPSC